MNMKNNLMVLCLVALSSVAFAQSTDPIFVPVNPPNETELNKAIMQVNADPAHSYRIILANDTLGTTDFRITAPLDKITHPDVILTTSNKFGITANDPIVFAPGPDYTGPFLQVASGAHAKIKGLEIAGFRNVANGGTFAVESMGWLSLGDIQITGSSSGGNGGGVWCDDDSRCDIFDGSDCTDCSATGDGGGFGCGQDTTCNLDDTGCDNCNAGGDGGGLYCAPGSLCDVWNSYIKNSFAAGNGGGYSCQSGARCAFWGTRFEDDSAGVFGCDGDVSGGETHVEGSSFEHPAQGACHTVSFEVPAGRLFTYGAHFATGPNNDAIDCTGKCELQNSSVDGSQGSSTQSLSTTKSDPGKGSSLQSQCNDFGTGAFTSMGFNLDTDGSCSLDQPTDLPNTNPMVIVDADGIPQPQAGSPLIESGPVDFVNNEPPCIYRDLNGLGRPQDFDLDGVFTCDRGPVEMQGGPDIGAPQTAAFFDADRNGEGVFVEILDGGLALISFYTYSLDGTTLTWYLGLGKVQGNSVVVDHMQKVTGGVFGAGFDANKIVRTNVGGMSLVFPDCSASASPGRLNFTVRGDSGLEHLLQKATRLTSVINCDGSKQAMAQRSGAFFDTGRSGEGIFVEWMADGRVILVFYTFDSAGNPFWAISDIGNTQISDNVVTANMLYAQGKTRYGKNFNPAEVNLMPWGTITLTYQSDNTLTFDYNSTVAGFGAGSYDYSRLSQPAGTLP